MSCLLDMLIASRVHISDCCTVLVSGLTTIFRRKRFIWLIYFHNSPSQREARARTKVGILRQEAGIKAETTEEPCLQVCIPWLAQVFGFYFILFYTTQCHLPREGTTHSELGPLMSSINQENAPPAFLQGRLMESSSNGGPFSQWLVYVTLANPNQHT